MTQMKTSSDEMKVAIIANGKPQSRRVASKLFNAFRDDPDFYLTKKNPDVVISIGGDGMLLSAFHMYEKELARVRFVGIHTGHLGFYTDYLDSEVDQLIETLRKDSGAKISYPLLNVKLTLADGRSFTSIASMKQPSSVMRKLWRQMFALMMSCLRASVVMDCQCQRLQDQRPTINLWVVRSFILPLKPCN